jgi:thiosulfate reductase cytochrome b subunit
MFEDPWDAAHITTWNFLPSLLRHVGVAPLWAVHVLYAVWLLVAIALVFTAVRLGRALQQKEGPTQSSSAL